MVFPINPSWAIIVVIKAEIILPHIFYTKIIPYIFIKEFTFFVIFAFSMWECVIHMIFPLVENLKYNIGIRVKLDNGDFCGINRK